MFHAIRMRVLSFCLLALFAFLMNSCAAVGTRGFPGEMWNEFRAPSGPFEHGTVVLDGRIQQGINVGTAGPFRVIPFGELRYRLDSAGLPWNDMVAPSIGIKLRKDFVDGFIQFGIQGLSEHRFMNGESGAMGLFFIQSWFGWDAKRHK